MNIKTVVIVNDFNYIQGGASKIAIDTAKLLKDIGIKVYFFSAVNNKKDNINGIEYVSSNQKEALLEKNKLKGMINGIYNIKAKKKLGNLLKKLDNKTTIIHIHGWTKALSSSVFKIANKMNFKIALTIHDYFIGCPNGGYFNYTKNTICNLRSMSLKCIKCNCDSRNYFVKLYRIVRQKVQNNIVKKINGYAIYVSAFSKEKLQNSNIGNWYSEIINNPAGYNKEKLKDIRKNTAYVHIARISKEKGTELFCKSITNVGKEGIVVGEGPERKELEEKYKNIKFVGWKNKDEIKEILLNSRALIFTSLLYETMGLTAIEALSLGIPVIVGDNSATASYISNGVNGFKYNIGNLADLSEKINFLDNDELLMRMSNNAYTEYWKNPFSEEIYKDKILKIYNKMLE